MKALFVILISFFAILPAFANIDYECEKMANLANFAGIYYYYEDKNFDSLDGMARAVYVGAAHLANKNEVGYKLRKKLTDADWAMVDGYMTNPDVDMIGAGECVLFAMICVIRGDYAEATRYTDRCLDELEASAKRIDDMDYLERDAAAKLSAEVLGMYATAAFLQEEHEDSLTAYEQLGQINRLMTEIEQSAEAAGVNYDSVIAAQNTASTATDTASADRLIDALTEQLKHEMHVDNLMLLDTLFNNAVNGWETVAYFMYHHGRVLDALDSTANAFERYTYATNLDSECRLFWNMYLERETSIDMIDFRAQDQQKAAKKNKDNPRHVIQANDCLIKLGKFDQVLKESTKFLKKNPDNSLVLMQRARAHYELKDNAKASADANAAVTADNSNYEAWYVLAQVAQQNSDPKAKEYFKKAILYSPKESRIHKEAQTAYNKL